jgi:hypothetical protein
MKVPGTSGKPSHRGGRPVRRTNERSTTMIEVLALQTALKAEGNDGNGPAWCSIISVNCTTATN